MEGREEGVQSLYMQHTLAVAVCGNRNAVILSRYADQLHKDEEGSMGRETRDQTIRRAMTQGYGVQYMLRDQKHIAVPC